MSRAQGPARPRLALAHFMLGNTYSWTDMYWQQTYESVCSAGLDGLVLNLGPEEWQYTQAQSAYRIFAERNGRTDGGRARALGLCLSLDMNVLPSTTLEHMVDMVEKVYPLLAQPAAIKLDGGALLSTFSGHTASWNGEGWAGLLDRLQKLGSGRIMFVPVFFQPPEEYTQPPYVHGAFNWNAAWPAGGHPVHLGADEPFLSERRGKLYMAAVSPCFFTHYGTTGPWAWDKNWIYRSDDLLLPRRFRQLIDLPAQRQPDLLQIVSWNDYGESHYVGPVMGDQPGSQAWTDGMDHAAFAGMVAFWVDRWKRQRRGLDLAKNDAEWGKLWIWYRTHPVKAVAATDQAVDLINISVVPPEGSSRLSLTIENGNEKRVVNCENARIHLSTIPFVAGSVRYVLSARGNPLLRGEGQDIAGTIERYNFNFWTVEWTFQIREGPDGPELVLRT